MIDLEKENKRLTLLIKELEAQLKEVKEIARDKINISAIVESSRSKLDRIYKLIESSPTEQPEAQNVDDVQWQDIMTTAAGIEPQEEQSGLQIDYTDYHVELWNEVLSIVEPYEENRGPIVYKKMIDCLNKNFTITRKHHD